MPTDTFGSFEILKVGSYTGVSIGGASPQSVATGNTIAFGPVTDTVNVTTAGAVTGVIMTAGVRDGQEVTIVHQGAAANTITMAAAGTSNVADGVSDVITGPSCRKYKWVASTALWYKVG